VIRDAENMTYSFPIYYSVIAALLGLVSGIVAFRLIRARKPAKSIMTAIIIAVVLMGIFAPGLALDRITISDSYIEQNVGFWFAPSTQFHFANIAAIHIGIVKDAKYRDRKAWFIQYRDGHVEKFRPGTLWELNEADIVKHLKSAKVVFN